MLNGCPVIGIFQIKMAGEHIGKATHLAPAHRIGLPCDRQGPAPNATDPARCEMTVENGVDLVTARSGLVHTLTENGDHFLVADPHFAKRGKIRCVQSRDSDIIAKGGLQG